jgi:hypothetical protein
MSLGFRSFRRRPVSRNFFISQPLNAFLNLVTVCALLLASALVLGAGGAPARPPVLNSYGKLPLSFEANHGQTDEQVRFIARGAGYTLFLTPTEAVFSLQQSRAAHSAPSPENARGNGSQELTEAVLNHAPKPAPGNNSILRVQLVDADRKAMVTGVNELPGRTNYFHGNDPSKWTTDLATFAKVQYKDVLKGIDLVYYGNQGQLEYDFVVSAGADTRLIDLNFIGARNLHRDTRTGDLVLQVEKEEIRFHKPVAYQEEASNKHLIAADYILDSENHVRFALGQYDRSRPLVIDPTLSYSTYLGGSSNDYTTSIAIDSTGSAYVTGYTNSLNFPTTSGAYQIACGGACSGTTVDAFVSKLDPTGSFLVYSTYLGGAGNDYGNGIAVDASGNAYIVGQTFSKNFPTVAGSFQTRCGTGNCSGGDAFITELNSTGSALIYSTYLGGNGASQGNAIALDSSNNAYLTGYTQSATFPVTPGAFQTTCKCMQPVSFVTKLNSNGSALIYSSYLGGTKGDVGYAVALDSSTNAYLTGYTHSTDFPTTPGAFQIKPAANTAVFVTEMNATGSGLIYSTYLGGATTVTTPCEACATAITVDSSGDAYVCGLTAESNFPITPGAFQTVFKSSPAGHDAFITELNPTGTALVFSTYVGGTGDDGATSIELDSSGDVWFKGNTKSTDFPVTPGAFQLVNAGDFDAYLAELNSTGTQLLYSTYLGGSGTEYGGATAGLALDTQVPPDVYMTGYTNSTNFPVVPGSLQTSNAGENDGFVSKFSPSPNVGLSPGLSFGYQTDGTTSAPQTMTVTNTGNTTLTVSSVTITGTNAPDFSQTNTCTAGGIAPQATCAVTVTFTPSISGNETADVSLADNAPSSPQLGSLTGYGLGNGPAVVLSPASLTFATQLVGTTSQPKAVTLSNVGNAALAITSITVGPNFLQTNTCGSSVAAGASCTITVTFRPTTINTLTGSVAIADNASGSPQTVAVSGVGTVVVLTPASINFGKVTVGTSSPARVATFSNAGKVSLAIQSLSIIGPDPADFSETNTCGTSLPPAGKCTINITFNPNATGGLSATLSITDGGGASPQSVTLIGIGQ